MIMIVLFQLLTARIYSLTGWRRERLSSASKDIAPSSSPSQQEEVVDRTRSPREHRPVQSVQHVKLS